MDKRLYKSNENRMIDGVCGGIAEYFNMDPTLVRLGWVLFALKEILTFTERVDLVMPKNSASVITACRKAKMHHSFCARN